MVVEWLTVGNVLISIEGNREDINEFLRDRSVGERAKNIKDDAEYYDVEMKIHT